MPIIHTATNREEIAYVLRDGGKGQVNLGYGFSYLEAEYMAIIYGLNEFFIRWNREIDSRMYDGLEEETTKVPIPSRFTKRPLPPPTKVYSSSMALVRQLNNCYKIDEKRLAKLNKQVKDMTKNLTVEFQWIGEEENLARRLLK